MSHVDLVKQFWTDSTMRGETLLFVQPSGDDEAQASLALTPTRIIRVQSADGTKTYEAGQDYVQAGRVLRLPAGSRIPVLTEAQLYPPRGSQRYGTCRTREADILFADKTEYHVLQVAVTYEFAPGDWQTPATITRKQSLPRLAGLLAAKKDISVVLLGDSISAGCNSSALYNAPPHQPAYGQLTVNAIAEHFGVKAKLLNLSVAGTNSNWGLTQVDDAGKAKPDLMLLAFGMNDASEKAPPEKFGAAIQGIMEGVRKVHPETEFILVSGMTGNPEWTHTHEEFYSQYRQALLKLAVPGVAVADVTSLWLEFQNRKKFYDLTGNGLNHPNDFGHRLYGQVLWSLLMNIE